MLKKLSLVLSVLAALGFTVTISAPADAKPQGGSKSVHVNKTAHVNKTVHVNKSVNVHRNVHVNKTVHGHGNFVVGRSYNGHRWFGHNRHFWHGQWYDYGIGTCWINVDGDWFWNELACPL